MSESKRREEIAAAAASLQRPLPPDVSVAVLYVDLALHVLGGMAAQMQICKVKHLDDGLQKAMRALSEARTEVLREASSGIVVAAPGDVPGVQ